MAFDIKGIENSVENLRIGYNKEENKISVENTDKSTHIHYHIHLTLPNEVISKIAAIDVEKFIKDTTIQIIKRASEERPQDMYRLAGLYNPVAFSTGASGVVISNATSILGQNTPMPSGDFVNQLPGIIESSIKADDADSLRR